MVVVCCLSGGERGGFSFMAALRTEVPREADE